MTRRIGERLHHHHPMPPPRLEIVRQPPQRRREHPRREVRSAILAQHTKPLIVGHIPQPAVALLVAPPDQRLPRSHTQRSGPEPDQRAPPTIVVDRDVTHHLTNQTRRTQPMRRLQRLIEPGTLTNRDRPDHHRPSHPRCWNTQSHPELVPPRTTRAPVSSHQPSSDTHLTTLPKPCLPATANAAMSGSTRVTATAIVIGTRGSARSTWLFRSCARAPTIRRDCSSTVGVLSK